MFNVTCVTEQMNKQASSPFTGQMKPHTSPVATYITHSFHWHVQNAKIPCRSQELLPFLCVMYFFLPPSPPTILPSSLTSSCHLFLGLPLNLVVPKFIYNTLFGILFSSILCTCRIQCNLFNLTVYIITDFLTIT